MTAQILKQKSKKLEQLLADIGPDFGKLESKRDAVFEQGRKEGFNEMEIGDMVRSKMKEHYSDRTIRRVLPDAAKHTEFANKADKMSASERPPLEIPTAKVEPTNKALPSSEVRTVKGIENEPVSNDAPKTTNVKEDSEPQMQQPQSDDTLGEGVQEIIDDAKEKLRLIDESHKLEKENIELQHQLDTLCLLKNEFKFVVEENKTLKKQLEVAKPFLELLSLIPVKEQVQVLYGIQDQLEEAREKIQSRSSKRGPKA